MARGRGKRQQSQARAPLQHETLSSTAYRPDAGRRAQYLAQDRLGHRGLDSQRFASQQTQGNPRRTHQQKRAYLQERVSRNNHTQSELQASHGPQATRGHASKRKRSETDEELQPLKKTRINTDEEFAAQAEITPANANSKSVSVPGMTHADKESKSASAPGATDGNADGKPAVSENIISSAISMEVLKTLSDAQKMANRRSRFATMPVERRVLGASRISKPNAGTSASMPKSHQEFKMAAIADTATDESIKSRSDSVKENRGDSGDKHGSQPCGEKSPTAAAIDTVQATPSKTSPVCPEDPAVDIRADSVVQSSPASNAESPPKGAPDACKPAEHKLQKPQLQKPRAFLRDDSKRIVQTNPEYAVEYLPYDSNSVLLMASSHIAHDEAAEPWVDRGEEYDPILNRDAMDMYAHRWTPEDFGRGPINKKLPVRVIDDCDLYFHTDQQIYVATEMGLLRVADYCRLMGMPDDQGLRFEGRKPQWAKNLEAARQSRRVTQSFDPDDLPFDTDLPFIELEAGGTVEVYEVVEQQDKSGHCYELAYGMRTEDSVRGFFDYQCTCRMDWGPDPEDDCLKPDPTVIDWSKFDYGPGVRNARQYLADVAAGKYKKKAHWGSMATTTAKST